MTSFLSAKCSDHDHRSIVFSQWIIIVDRTSLLVRKVDRVLKICETPDNWHLNIWLLVDMRFSLPVWNQGMSRIAFQYLLNKAFRTEMLVQKSTSLTSSGAIGSISRSRPWFTQSGILSHGKYNSITYIDYREISRYMHRDMTMSTVQCVASWVSRMLYIVVWNLFCTRYYSQLHIYKWVCPVMAWSESLCENVRGRWLCTRESWVCGVAVWDDEVVVCMHLSGLAWLVAK